MDAKIFLRQIHILQSGIQSFIARFVTFVFVEHADEFEQGTSAAVETLIAGGLFELVFILAHVGYEEGEEIEITAEGLEFAVFSLAID